MKQAMRRYLILACVVGLALHYMAARATATAPALVTLSTHQAALVAATE